eukprot:gene15519-20947_t
MDQFSVKSDAFYCRFLGTSKQLLFVGNTHSGLPIIPLGPSSYLQIYYYEGLNGKQQNSENQKEYYCALEKSITKDKCCGSELCNIRRFNVAIIALILSDLSQDEHYISLVQIETDYHQSSFKIISSAADANGKSNNKFLQSSIAYTSIAYSSDLEILAISDEIGQVILYSIQSQQEIYRLKVDGNGINKVLFIRTGQLVTVSNSRINPIKIWSIVQENDNNIAMALQQSLKLHTFPSLAKQISYSCVICHPIQELLFCGTSEGFVVMYDLKLGISVDFKPHDSKVNDIMIHPSNFDIIFTASSDGTVKCFNFSKLTTSLLMDMENTILTNSSQNQKSYFSFEEYLITNDIMNQAAYETVFTEPSSFQCLDYDAGTNTIAAVSNLGRVFILSL